MAYRKLKKLMEYNIKKREVAQRVVACAISQATIQNIGDKIGELLPQVYDVLQVINIQQFGNNIVIYWDKEDDCLLLTEQGIHIDVGVQVDKAFEPVGQVRCSATPAGVVATTTHIGSYQQLPSAHAAIRNWCKENGYFIAGVNWEVYGDWNDDPTKLMTEVFYLLKHQVICRITL